MFVSSTPRLKIRRPSPTTAEFTVSNAPTRQFLTARLVFYLTALLRLAVVLLALVTLAAKAQGQGQDNTTSLWVAAQTPLWFQQTVLSQPWELVLPISAGALFLAFRRFHTEESLLVLRSLGVQTSTTSSTYLSTARTRFIPTSQIQDIFIHEAFKGFEVRYYLAVVVEDEEEVTVVFPNLLPKLEIVEQVWREARVCLFETGAQGSK